MIKAKRKGDQVAVTMRGDMEIVGVELIRTIVSFSKAAGTQPALAAMLSAMDEIYGEEDAKRVIKILGEMDD